MIHYPKKVVSVKVLAASSVVVALFNQTQPIEQVCIWVEAAAAGDYTATPQLNGQDIAALVVANVLTVVPQLIQMPGIVPKEIEVGVKLTNNGAGPLVLNVNLVARSMGA